MPVILFQINLLDRLLRGTSFVVRDTSFILRGSSFVLLLLRLLSPWIALLSAASVFPDSELYDNSV